MNEAREHLRNEIQVYHNMMQGVNECSISTFKGLKKIDNEGLTFVIN